MAEVTGRHYPPRNDRQVVRPSAILPPADSSADDVLAVVARIQQRRRVAAVDQLHAHARRVSRLEIAIEAMVGRCTMSSLKSGLVDDDAEVRKLDRAVARQRRAASRLVEALGRLALAGPEVDR